jgi:Tol biopolymer transport system component
MRMTKIGITLCLASLLVLGTGTVWAQERYPDRGAVEKLVAPIDSSIWLPDTFRISPDMKRVAYVAQVNDQEFVVVDGIEGKPFDEIIKWSLIFSWDSKRFAYIAKEDNKQIVVVDGAEGKPYDVVKTNPMFNPDCKKIVYVAQAGDKVCVVVDGKEGKVYDEILSTGGGKIVFDSADQIHYYARSGNSVVYVEEKIV